MTPHDRAVLISWLVLLPLALCTVTLAVAAAGWVEEAWRFITK